MIINEAITKSQKDIIWAFARLAETRDEITGSHLERVMLLTEILAVELSQRKKYQKYLTSKTIKQIAYAAILHDIGKIGVSDLILNKPNTLTTAEFDMMKTHTEIGTYAVSSLANAIENDQLIALMQDVVAFHHENYNGTGYPYGLDGAKIPLCAQIVAVADVYDAIRSKRPYKNKMTHEEAYDLIIDEEEIKFSSDLIEAFDRKNKTFEQVYDCLTI